MKRATATRAVALSLLVALAAGAVAADAPSGPSEQPAAVGADGRRTLGRLPANLGRTTIGVFNKQNLLPVLVGGAATGVSSIWDDELRDSIHGGPLAWGDAFETAGGPVYTTLFVAGMFTAGRLAHGARFRAMTYDMLDAAIVNLAYTEVLKLAVGRERPNGGDNKSFPSGHTSDAFAMASVAQGHYGWKLGVPAYLVAGVMGASRVNQDKHWLSDVVAGATLGYVVGRTAVRVDNRALEGAPLRQATWTLSPVVASHARGLSLSVVF